MLEVSRVNERTPRPRQYSVGPFAGPAAGASTFKRGGIIVTGSQGTETVTKVTVSSNTISTGATVDTATNANATVITITGGGNTIATATNATADIADGDEAALTSTAADLILSDGDILLVEVATAAGGEATQLVDYCLIVETQPTV